MDEFDNKDNETESGNMKPWQDLAENKEPESGAKPWQKESEYKYEPVSEAPRSVETPETEPKPEPEHEPEPEPEPAKKNDYSTQQYIPPKYQGQYTNTYYSESPKKTPKKNNSGITALVIICVACVILLGAIVLFMYKNGWKLPESNNGENTEQGGDSQTKGDKKEGESNPIISPDMDDTQSGEDVDIEVKGTDGKNTLSYGSVYKKCASAAVGIRCTQNVSSFYYGTYEQSYVGSGFVIDKRGYIATNAHVVDGMNTITVYFTYGEYADKKYEAKLIGSDVFSDIAVIKIEAEGDLPVLEFGDSTRLEVGDIVTAIGTPADIALAGTFTQGIISAVDRDIEVTGTNNVKKIMRLLQTDATINPGNSGGPLLNMYGQVVGINTLKLTDEFEGIGFSIPSAYASKIVEQIISSGGKSTFDPDNDYVKIDETPQMGIANCQDITKEMAEYYDVPQGVQILLLEKGCSLEKNGALVGDIITKMNGKTISDLESLKEERDKVKPRSEATITVYRNGKYIDITFTMGSNISY